MKSKKLIGLVLAGAMSVSFGAPAIIANAEGLNHAKVEGSQYNRKIEVQLFNAVTGNYIPQGTKVTYDYNGSFRTGIVNSDSAITVDMNHNSKYLFIANVKVAGYSLGSLDGMIENGKVDYFGGNGNAIFLMPHANSYSSTNFTISEGSSYIDTTSVVLKVDNKEYKGEAGFNKSTQQYTYANINLGKDYPANTKVEVIVKGMSPYTTTLGDLQNQSILSLKGMKLNLKTVLQTQGTQIRVDGFNSLGKNSFSNDFIYKNQPCVITVGTLTREGDGYKVHKNEYKGYTDANGYLQLDSNVDISSNSMFYFQVEFTNPNTRAIQNESALHNKYSKWYTFGSYWLLNPKSKEVGTFGKSNFELSSINNTISVPVSNVKNGSLVNYSCDGINGTGIIKDGEAVLNITNSQINNIKSSNLTLQVNGYNRETTKLVKTVVGNNISFKINPVNFKSINNVGSAELTIMSQETNRPLINTNITVNGMNYKTNSLGQVTISNLKDGNTSFTIGGNSVTETTVTMDIKSGETVNDNVFVAPATGGINITFVNKDTGRVIKDTNINVGYLPVTTNSNGVANLSPLWVSDSSYKVTASGYKSENVNINIVANKTGNMTIELTPNNYNPVVKDGTKLINYMTETPLVNANVFVNGKLYKTNSKGELPIDLVKGDKISSEGFNSVIYNTGSLTLIPYTGTAVLQFKHDGKPVSNTNVTIAGETLKTNNNGEISMSQLWCVSQTWSADISGFGNKVITFNVRPNTSTTTVYNI